MAPRATKKRGWQRLPHANKLRFFISPECGFDGAGMCVAKVIDGTISVTAATSPMGVARTELAIPEPIYVMRAAPRIRLIYRPIPNGIEVLDIVRKDTLHSFLNENPEIGAMATSAPAMSAANSNHATPAKSTVKKAVLLRSFLQSGAGLLTLVARPSQ